MGPVLLSNKIFSVRRVESSNGAGRTWSRDIVEHPGAVAILPILDAERVVMIRNYRFTVGRELLELPAGTLDPGETPETCAARELEEETGYRAGRIEPLGTFYTSPGFCTEQMYVFVARDLTATEQDLQEDERIRVEIMRRDALRLMLIAGEIDDGKSAAALGMFFLKNGKDG